MSTLTADGVEFVVGSKKYSAKASREVILSAGTVQTPQLLELSGAFHCFSVIYVGLKEYRHRKHERFEASRNHASSE